MKKWPEMGGHVTFALKHTHCIWASFLGLHKARRKYSIILTPSFHQRLHRAWIPKKLALLEMSGRTTALASVASRFKFSTHLLKL
ncbi:hypothetical protein GDO78_005688 [Eleutherodactylus coqui]|uniref:Uncharacterized protein n=1 Tax=Eleutherodactylus coqui TaxID=57060 RepID=A0A8J6KFM4_ELECQ|nr:hypothetical protein GDO78_005688 [Eleutherodactylus coqui]